MPLQDALAHLQNAGYERREAQVAMMELVEKSLSKAIITIIEGGTGIGKSFGYLVPLLQHCQKDSKLNIVIATATVNLQSQLAEIDIPALEKIMGQRIVAEVAKGRRRYICPSRLYQQHSGDTQPSFAGMELPKPSTAHMTQIDELLGQLESGRWDGDRDRLATPIEQTLWQTLSTDAVGCSNKRCAHFQACPYFKAKRRLAQADIIIANHDLLLSDISLGTGSLLPKAEDTFYVIDEAHHFPAKAVQHFSASVPLRNCPDWLDHIAKGAPTIAAMLTPPETALGESVQGLCQEALLLFEPLFEFVHSNFPTQQREGVWLLPEMVGSLQALISPLAKSCQTILSHLLKLRQKFSEQHSERTLSNFDQTLTALGYHVSHSESMASTFQLFCHETADGEPPVARWFSLPRDAARQDARPAYLAHAAMISAAPYLLSHFWEKLNHGAVLCSATLRSLGQFTHFLEKTGLEHMPKVESAAYQSPFDYSQSEIVIPPMQTIPQGEASDAHTQELCATIPKLLEAKPVATLVLFTSQRVMDTVYQALPQALIPRIFLQGALAKPEIIRRHKERVDQHKPSIIFGLQSFAEGVDLPGNYCQHVIITKLPFAVPSTPIERTWIDWLESRGKNGFMEHTLPETSLRLTQFVGRLIRTQQDIGTITILDRRVVQKQYGKQLLANLPPFRVSK